MQLNFYDLAHEIAQNTCTKYKLNFIVPIILAKAEGGRPLRNSSNSTEDSDAKQKFM